MKKMLNEGNLILNFISSSGSDFLTSYGSGSTSQKVTVLTVPVPQHCLIQGEENTNLKNTEIFLKHFIGTMYDPHQWKVPLLQQHSRPPP
jgi:hypothetical protein